MDMGLPIPGGPTNPRSRNMTFSLNRILDVVASVAIVVLSVITAGATVVLGA
jgi:hypothetical protein